MWHFLQYQSKRGRLPVSDWYDNLSQKNKSRLDRFLGNVKQLTQPQGPYFHKFESLYEARWRGEHNVPHRIFCYFPSIRRVTFLCGFIHKDNIYKPPNAYKTATTRYSEIQRGEAHELEFNV